MACPHVQWTQGSVDFEVHISVPLCFHRARSMECVECDLLLRVVKEYKPGWISGDYTTDSKLFIGLEHGYGDDSPKIIRLLEGTPKPSWSNENEPNKIYKYQYDGLEVVGSFCYFRRKKEEAEEPIYKQRPSLVEPALLFESMNIIKDTSLPSASGRVAKWLSHCLQNHEQCKNPYTDYMPRRLLHVGSENTSPFLFKPTRRAPYVCLSYCWGIDTGDILKTTKHNLEAHYKAVLFSELPNTIRDAVTLCRALQLENLWVDSLCIIQDDKESWLQDSGEMDKIYANAHLTIAAEEPASCKLGFLGEQQFGKSDWQREFITDVPVETGGPRSEVLIRPMPLEDELPERCSLDRRGWCLQEAVLSIRRICFNGKEMTWECASSWICECGHLQWNPPQLQYTEISSRLHHGYENKTRKLIHQDWITLVEEYSQRSLTQESDKLVAISGISKNFANKSFKMETFVETDYRLSSSEEEGSEFPVSSTPSNQISKASPSSIIHNTTAYNYKAGLWRDTFIVDLSWRVVKQGHEAMNHASYLAPTWSWASVNKAVRYDYFLERGVREPDITICCTVEDVSCEAIMASDPTGSLKDAYAIITGKIVCVELVVLDGSLTRLWHSNSYRPWVGNDLTQPKVLVRTQNLWSVEIFLDRPREPYTVRTVVYTDDDSECWIRGACNKPNCCWKAETSGIAYDNRFYCLKLFASDEDVYYDHRFKGEDEWFLVLQKSVEI